MKTILNMIGFLLLISFSIMGKNIKENLQEMIINGVGLAKVKK